MGVSDASFHYKSGFFLKELFNDTHREKAPSNKTPALTKSTNVGIWVVGASNELCIRVLKILKI